MNAFQNSVKLVEMLSNADGAPGFEGKVAQIAKESLHPSLDVRIDKFNNVIARKEGSKAKRTVLIDAHTDEVAFMIQSITSKGLLKVVTLGGWIGCNVAASRIRITNTRGEIIRGVFASKPPHFMSDAEKNAPVSVESLLIDVGAVSRKEIIEEYALEIGMPVIPDVEFSFTERNGLMLGKGFDDRLGSSLVIEIMNELANEQLNINLAGSLTCQEEVGTRGIRIVAENVKPDLAIVLEGTPADDAFTPEDEAQGAIGKGPQLRHRDLSMITHNGFATYAKSVAKDNGIRYQEAVRTGGGTNAGVLHLSGEGVPTIVIGVPVRHAHTHYGFSKIEDYCEAKKWVKEIIRSLSDEAYENI